MSSNPPQTADAENLGVMCLTELRDPALRSTVLQGFQNDTGTAWTIYQPAPTAQPGCSNACNQQQTYTAYGTTPTLNEWVQFCSLAPVPGAGYSCSQVNNQAGYDACMAQFCPFPSGALPAANNPQCGYCLGDQVPGESLTSRVFRCSQSCSQSGAASCTMAYGGDTGTAIVSRYPIAATEYHQFAPQGKSRINSVEMRGVLSAALPERGRFARLGEGPGLALR